MKKYYYIILGFLILSFGCSKTISNESGAIIFTTDAAVSNINVASNFPVVIKITSAISPNGGLKVELTAVEEVSGLSVLPQSPLFTTTTANNGTSIINLPQQKWVVATVKITDINKATNTASKSFRVIYK